MITTFDEHCKEIGMTCEEFKNEQERLKSIAKGILRDAREKYQKYTMYFMEQLSLESYTKDIFEYNEVIQNLKALGMEFINQKEGYYFRLCV